jgi:predicted AAA+ superfamily ATPase
MIPRSIAPTVTRLSQGFPAVAITGPRQSGKTTLARVTFPEHPYVSLENPDTRAFAEADPRAFLDQYRNGAILDEIQRCPDLFSYLQGSVDADAHPGRFILTGSQQFDLRSRISQSLAGRVGLIQLLPFSLPELQGAGMAPDSVESAIFKGGYPPLFDRPVLPADWIASYVATYLERDVRQLVQVRDLRTFQTFVRMCASRAGQLLNLSSLASDCGITHNTAKAWISVLEASYIVFLLSPHHRNFGKRLTKSPKLYFLDTGLLCWLLGIRKSEEIVTHALRGALFENWVILELIKGCFNRGQPSNLFFWRDSAGNEIDVLVEQGGQLLPIEIKAGKTIAGDYFSGLAKWSALANGISIDPTLVYAGDQGQERSQARVIPWHDVDRLADRS